MSKIPGTANITIHEEVAKTVTRPKLKNIVDSFEGGKTFDEGLAIAAANFKGKAAGFTENAVEFLRPYATRLVAEGALVWNQTEEEKAAGLAVPTARAPKEPAAPVLDEHGNPVPVAEKPKRQRKSRKAKDETAPVDGENAEALTGESTDAADELPADLQAE